MAEYVARLPGVALAPSGRRKPKGVLRSSNRLARETEAVVTPGYKVSLRMEHDKVNDHYSGIRVAVFDDAQSAQDIYRTIFEGHQLFFSDRATISQEIREELIAFQPHLIVVDLVIAESRDDGYRLIKQLSRIPEVRGVPLVVCSKLINDTELGLEVQEKVGKLPGVEAALPKSPSYPSKETFLKYLNLSSNDGHS